MNLEKLKPWNWFKHEEPNSNEVGRVPITREAQSTKMPSVGGVAAGQGGSLSQLHQEIDRLFDQAFRGFGLPTLSGRFFEPDAWLNSNSYRPSLNVASDDTGYDITVEAPGMSEDDITIEVRDDLLIVTGNKQEAREEKDKHFYRVERHYGTFQRVLSLPQDAEVEGIDATLKNGVLAIRIPRSAEASSTAKRIPIRH